MAQILRKGQVEGRKTLDKTIVDEMLQQIQILSSDYVQNFILNVSQQYQSQLVKALEQLSPSVRNTVYSLQNIRLTTTNAHALKRVGFFLFLILYCLTSSKLKCNVIL